MVKARGKRTNKPFAFSIVEMIVVIVVIGILAGIAIFAFNSWRDRTANTEVKWDANNIASAMKNASNWANGFPVFTEGTEFNGGAGTDKVYKQSNNVKLTYFKGDTKSYCIDAVSRAVPSVGYYIEYSPGGPVVKKGTCAGGDGVAPVPTDPSQTLFVFDTTLNGCSGTVTLPIQSPSSAFGSSIAWGDGVTTSLTTQFPNHTFSRPGKHIVAYNGPIDRIDNRGVVAANAPCLSQLLQWSNSVSPVKVSFYGATNLSYVSEPPHTVTDMSGMFSYTTSYNQDISGWDVSKVTSMSEMFSFTSAFNQSLNSWNTGNVTDMWAMFFRSNFNGAIGNWNTSKVTNMGWMFMQDYVFNQPVGNWNTSNVTDMNQMFYGKDLGSAFNQPLNTWNVSKVTSIARMFEGTTSFNQPLSNWDVSNVVNMEGVFDSSAFNQPIGGWNTSRVTNMMRMFKGNKTFNQPIGTWNTGLVTNMQDMFQDAYAFNQPLGTWNVSNVTNMQSMFGGAGAFNQPIGAWNTSRVANMNSMFSGAGSFNQPIGTWDTSSVTDMTWMFGSYKWMYFNQPIGTWNTSKVTSMNCMFCAWGGVRNTFNQNVSGWNVAAVTDHTNFRLDSYLTAANSPPGW